MRECRECSIHKAQVEDLQEKLARREKLLALKKEENQLLEQELNLLKKK